jgi:hypothetical protein
MSKFVHMELNTGDPAAAKKFYSSLFGWKVEDMKMGDGSVYTMVAGPEGGIGGIQLKPMADAPTQWIGYVSVAAVEKSVTKARGLGAHIVVDRTEIPGMGAFAIMLDPTGAAIGIWEPAAMPAAPEKADKKAGKKKAAEKKAGNKAAKKTDKKAKKAEKKAKKAKKAEKKAEKKAKKAGGAKKSAKKKN